MATPEGKVKKVIKDLLKEYGAWFFMPVQGGFGRAGVPDFIGVHKGRFFAVETKGKEGQRPTRLQQIEMRDIAAQGGTCFVVAGQDGLEDLKVWLGMDTAFGGG